MSGRKRSRFERNNNEYSDNTSEDSDVEIIEPSEDEESENEVQIHPISPINSVTLISDAAIEVNISDVSPRLLLQNLNQDIDNFFSEILMNDYSNEVYNYDPPTPVPVVEHSFPAYNYFRNDISLLSNLQSMLVSSRYRINEYNDAIDHFNAMSGDDNLSPSIQILNIILDLYFDSFSTVQDGIMPNRSQVVARVITYMCSCLRSYQLPVEQFRQIVDHIVFGFGRYPICYDILLIVEYQTLQHTLPNAEQFDNFMINNLSFFNDPENFHNNDKIHIPTLNLDKYERIKVSSETRDSCGICQEEFQEGHTLIKLEPCGHQFHSLSEECLDTASVIEWLTNHNFCPLCKTKVTKDKK